MEYSKLSIHQKINAKHNRKVFYSYSPLNLKRMQNRDGALFTSNKLMLEAEGIHNNRNYDGPGDNYYQL
jgi:hypothetical protein